MHYYPYIMFPAYYWTLHAIYLIAWMEWHAGVDDGIRCMELCMHACPPAHAGGDCK